ncbi:MAG: PAS domain-containing protein [Bacteroidetes bacterium]|nr:PAS domain-containing protein [Bacteroidota bacterium]
MKQITPVKKPKAKENHPLSKMQDFKNFVKHKEEVLFYEKVFDSINAFVFIIDLKTNRFLWVNSHHQKLLGYKINHY